MKNARGSLLPLLFWLTLAIFSLAGFVPELKAQTDYQWTLFAGTDGGTGYADGTGSAARFQHPRGGVAIDASGNLYVTDTYNNLIRMITPGGVVSTLAGKVGVSGSRDGTRSEASFKGPHGIAVDRDGNVYVSDGSNHTIRKITPSGEVSTLAGSPGNTGSADGTGSDARFYYPEGLAIDSHGNLFVADSSNHTIRKITPAGVVSTFAGNPSVSTGIDGTGTNAGFYYPHGLAIDSGDNLYVADGADGTVRKITPTGAVSTVAGRHGSAGYVEGTGSSARFSNPHAIAVDSDGNLFVTDISNGVIRKITPSGATSTLAKNLEGATGTPLFYDAEGMAVDSYGNLYVAAWSANVIYKIAPTGVGSSLAGKKSVTENTDATGDDARFNRPQGFAMDRHGNLFVADSSNHTIRKVSPAGTVSTVAGKAGVSGYADGTGGEARFYKPFDVAVDIAGNIYVSDALNNRIRKITPVGVVTTLAGGASGIVDGTGSSARFFMPHGLALDSKGNLLVVDNGNQTIRKVTPDGVVTTVAGSPRLSGSTDGFGSAARFNYPNGIAVDGNDNVYVADTMNCTIRKITPAGIVSTFAGQPKSAGETNGLGTDARFYWPVGISVDRNGNLYVVESPSNLPIRKITPAGQVSSLTDSAGEKILFTGIFDIAADENDNLYLLESDNSRITVGFVPGKPVASVNPVSDLLPRSASINGAIHPKVLPATAYFEYGLTTAYGSTVAITLAPGKGLTPQAVSVALSGLKPDTTYHYRLVAANNQGQSFSEDATFTTRCSIVVTTLAGNALSAGTLDGKGGEARFDYPIGLTVDSSGNIYVADQAQHTIRKITPDGTVATIAGKAGISGSTDGSSSTALFCSPSDVAVDANGNLYIAEWGNQLIRKITAEGIVSTIAGQAGVSGSVDGQGSAAQFSDPSGITLDNDGNLYVCEWASFIIRKVTPTGNVSTLAGRAGYSGTQEGIGTSAYFRFPGGIECDANGNLYVSNDDRTISKITPDRVVTRFAGPQIDTPSTGHTAEFNYPWGVAVDHSGNVYVADQGNNAIRRITPSGVVTTLAGQPGVAGNADGGPDTALFNNPGGISVGADGSIYVADTGNHTIRKITWVNEITLTTAFSEAGSVTGNGNVNQGSSQTVTATPAEAYFFSNWTENGAVVSTSPSYSFTVSEDRNLVANFTLKPFYQWWTTHVANGGVTDPQVSGPAATPLKDGAPNLVKYLCRIDPSAPMSESDKSSLPKMTVTERESKPYLTLTHRKNQAATDLNISVQASTDLKSWQTITPDFTSTVGTDPQTGDEIIQYQVNTEDSTQKFIRLNVTAP